jgi:hypothetical protein
MANNFASPSNGDVEFVCRGENGDIKRLYALSAILTAQSEYYATSLFLALKELISVSVFESPFTEGKPTVHNPPNDADQKTDVSPQNHKRTINSEDDVDLLHNILYFMYTDRITFGTNLKTTHGTTHPKLCAAEDIYMMADRMFLSELKNKALNFLKLSCTTDNIATRVMSKFSELHQEVLESYAEYFRKNWDRLKGTKEFDQLFDVVNDDLDEVLRINSRFRKLMQGAVFLDSN